MRALLLTACVVALAPFAWAADESYAIAIKGGPAPGKSATVRQHDKKTGTTKVTDADGNVVKDVKYQESYEVEYTETTIEKGGKAPKKFKHFYRKVRVDKGKGAVAEPHEGKVIVYQLKDGKYHASVEGKDELPEKELALLAKEADNVCRGSVDTVFLPGRAVKVGETWSVPGKKLATSSLGDLDPARSKGEARFVKAYKKGRQQWGTFSFRATGALPRLGPTASIELEGTFDAAIDGSSTAYRADATLTFAAKGTFKGGAFDQQFKIEMTTRRGEER
jgi:hypothetical protein